MFYKSTRVFGKNKKGFTMVELLAAIVILGILSITAIASVTRLVSKSKDEQIVHQEKTAIMATQSYFQANKDELPKAIGESRKIPLSKLKSTNYLKNNIKNADGKSCMEDSYVKVYKKSNSDYTYTAYIFCEGDTVTEEDETNNKPVIDITFEGEQNAEGNLQNVATAYLVIKITGGSLHDSVIDGYSYSLSVQTSGDTYLREVYNSGSLKGNGKTSIEFKKLITDYIDITDLTVVKARVVARNADGGYSSEELSKPISAETTEVESVSYHDQTRPTCYNLQEADADEWINVDGDKNNNHKRTVSVLCDDGDGSGCIREKFYRTWPNDKQTEAEWAYIQVKDNAGNTNIDNIEYFVESDPCKPAFIEDSCRVRVNVDVTHPVLDEIHAYKKGAGDSIAAGATDLITSADIVDKTGNSSTKKFQIANTAYDAIKNNEYWFNNTYENGVIYQIKIKDNLHLDSWKWEVNEPYQTSINSNGYKNLGSSAASENKSQSFPESIENSNCGQLETTILISFQDEGLRQGKLTVKDRAGNTTTLTIFAKIDRTAPDKPVVTYKKYNSSNSAVGTANYTPGTWSIVNVRASAMAVEDKYATKNGTRTTLSDNLSGFGTFQYKGTKHGGGEIPETSGSYIDFKGNLEGQNTVQFQACDKARNCSGYTDPKQVWVDTQAPTVVVTAKKRGTETAVADNVTANNSNREKTIANNAYTKNSSIKLVNGWMNSSNFSSGVKYTLAMSDNVVLASYKWDAGKSGEDVAQTSLSGTSQSKDVSLVAEGKRKGVLTVKDAAGNTVTVTVNAWLDRTSPTIPGITNSSGEKWTNQNVYLTLTSSDPKGSGMVGSSVSGMGKYQWKYNSTNWADYADSGKTSYKTSAYSAERNELAYQRACDKAGNCSSDSSTWIKIDKTSPNLVLSHTNSCSPGTGNVVRSSCNDTGPAQSGVPNGNKPGNKSVNWGSGGTLSFSCADNVGNTARKSYTLRYGSCACGENTCRYGCSTCGGGAYSCTYDCSYWYCAPMVDDSGCDFSEWDGAKCCGWIPKTCTKTCYHPTYDCNCDSCYYGHNTCRYGYY